MTGFVVAARTAGTAARSSAGRVDHSYTSSRVRRGDVELDEIAESLEPADHLDVLLGRLARGGHDEGHAVRQPAEGAPVAREPGILEAVAVDEARSFGLSGRGRGSGCGWPGRGRDVMLFAVTAPKPSPIARRRMRVS